MCPRLPETSEVKKERVVFKELDLWPQFPKSLENSEVLNVVSHRHYRVPNSSTLDTVHGVPKSPAWLSGGARTHR